MAKELPYFRFYPSEWLEGNITLEKEKTQSLFAQIMCWYWKKDCKINLEFIKKRLINNKATLKHCLNDLIESEIIKVNDNNYISIDFLDEQYDLLSEKRQKHVDSGRLGGKKKAINAKATLKQRSTYKDNNKDNINITFEKFWKLYDYKKNKPECEKLWNGEKKTKQGHIINNDIRTLIIKQLPQYVANTHKDDTYPGRQHPKTYLYNEGWNDEIVTSKSSQPKKEVNYYLYRCPVCQKEFKKREKKAEGVGGYECDEKNCQVLLTNNQYRGHYLKLKDIILKKDQ